MILCSLTFRSYGQDEGDLQTLGDRIKSHLEGDPTTLSILGQIYTQPLTAEFKNLLHLSLNNLLVSSEVLASAAPDQSIGLNQAPDFIQKGSQYILKNL